MIVSGIANFISLFRIPIGIIIAYLLGQISIVSYIIALMLVIIGELSDLVDGIIARKSKKFGGVTEVGKILDPMADSLFRIIIFCGLLNVSLIPMTLLLVIVIRDTVVSYIRVLMQQAGYTMSARTSGKYKAVFQAVCIFAVIINALFMFSQTPLWWNSFSEIIVIVSMWLAALVTLYSMVDYAWVALRKTKIL